MVFADAVYVYNSHIKLLEAIVIGLLMLIVGLLIGINITNKRKK
jgi:hypothetical protein